MLYFDVTKTSRQGHQSGLVRASTCLRRELGAAFDQRWCEVVWNTRRRTFVARASGRPIELAPADAVFSPELFSEEERPGVAAWLENAPCMTAALYYDAIPLRFPEITWPKSVARHPGYMRLLARFRVVLADSKSSAAELAGYWRWMGLPFREPVVLPLGADGMGLARDVGSSDRRAASRDLLMVGILEPRKRQEAVLNAAEVLWREGASFTLHLVGRVNPHFGKPIAARVRELRRARRPVVHHDGIGDAELAALMAGARFALMPSLAEGCGLPALEALWAGMPALVSDIPALAEVAVGGGCLSVPLRDDSALVNAMRTLLDEDARVNELSVVASTRVLPTWKGAASALWTALGC